MIYTHNALSKYSLDETGRGGLLSGLLRVNSVKNWVLNKNAT